jgi:hypothetical protein
MQAPMLTKITVVLHYVESQKCRMLVCVAKLLLPEDYADLRTRYPSLHHWFDAPLRRAMVHQIDESALPKKSLKTIAVSHLAKPFNTHWRFQKAETLENLQNSPVKHLG